MDNKLKTRPTAAGVKKTGNEAQSSNDCLSLPKAGRVVVVAAVMNGF